MKKTKEKKYKKIKKQIKKQIKKLVINTGMGVVVQEVIKAVWSVVKNIFLGLLSLLGGAVSPQQPTYQPSAQTVYEQSVQVTTTIDEVDQLIIYFH